MPKTWAKNAPEIHKKRSKIPYGMNSQVHREYKTKFKNFDVVMQVYKNDLGKYDGRTCLAIVFSHNSFHVKTIHMRSPNMSSHMIELLFDVL